MFGNKLVYDEQNEKVLPDLIHSARGIRDSWSEPILELSDYRGGRAIRHDFCWTANDFHG